jgi:hypothetical protein
LKSFETAKLGEHGILNKSSFDADQKYRISDKNLQKSMKILQA